MTCWRRRHESHAHGRPAFALGALSNLSFFAGSFLRSHTTLAHPTMLATALLCRRYPRGCGRPSLFLLPLPSANKERPIGAMKVPAKATLLQSAPRARLAIAAIPSSMHESRFACPLTLREIGKALCTMMACVIFFLSGLIRFQSRIKQEVGSTASRRAHHSALARLPLFKHTYTHPPNPYPLHPNVTRIAARSARTPSSPFDSTF
jgi:hypothetical protein